MKRYLGIGVLAIGGAVLSLGLTRDKSEGEEGPAKGYVMHEWGTFTSVHGSNGKMLSGLQREEEHLPNFVHAHMGMENRGFVRMKGWRRPLMNVTVKMETPVIYFYSEEGFQGTVEIGFRGGSISQWWPPRQGGEVPPKYDPPKLDLDADGLPMKPTPAFFEKLRTTGRIDFGESQYEGAIKWDFEVMKPDPRLEENVFRSGETLNWLRPRQTASNVIKAGGEFEKYLFYRGVGNITLPLELKVDSRETLTLRNTGKDAIPYALVYERTPAGRVGIYELKRGIDPGATITVEESALFPPVKEKPGYAPPRVGPEFEMMVEGLIGSGLRPDEASAMVQTWWDSYFEKPGLRVFWVVPGTETERILPLKITPKPREMVRVLVGRSEVLRPSFEKQLVKEFQAKKRDAWNVREADRYGSAYQERVNELAPPKVTKAELSTDDARNRPPLLR